MIDARGLSCPTPVILTQQAIKKDVPAALEVLVDAQVCVENITRLANATGYRIAVEPKDGEFLLKLTK